MNRGFKGVTVKREKNQGRALGGGETLPAKPSKIPLRQPFFPCFSRHACILLWSPDNNTLGTFQETVFSL